MTDWRRDFQENPERGNQEVRTAGLVARHLRALGFDVRENVAVTRLVGAILLKQNDEWAVQRGRYMTLETITPLSDNAMVRLAATAP
jgi:metal-dependent amidase/aminoacylase/carboxypeptidase family protein